MWSDNVSWHSAGGADGWPACWFMPEQLVPRRGHGELAPPVSALHGEHADQGSDELVPPESASPGPAARARHRNTSPDQLPLQRAHSGARCNATRL